MNKTCRRMMPLLWIALLSLAGMSPSNADTMKTIKQVTRQEVHTLAPPPPPPPPPPPAESSFHQK